MRVIGKLEKQDIKTLNKGMGIYWYQDIPKAGRVLVTIKKSYKIKGE